MEILIECTNDKDIRLGQYLNNRFRTMRIWLPIIFIITLYIVPYRVQ